MSLAVHLLDVKELILGQEIKEHFHYVVQEIKEHFHPNELLMVHWDGKLLEDLVGKKHVDCLPTLVSEHGISELLGVPKLVSGTGEMVATAIFNTIADWSISDQVSAMSFDTTALNTCWRLCAPGEKALEKFTSFGLQPPHNGISPRKCF